MIRVTQKETREEGNSLIDLSIDGIIIQINLKNELDIAVEKNWVILKRQLTFVFT
jgi:hypothetical protein